jgi:hypothetical protein
MYRSRLRRGCCLESIDFDELGADDRGSELRNAIAAPDDQRLGRRD